MKRTILCTLLLLSFSAGFMACKKSSSSTTPASNGSFPTPQADGGFYAIQMKYIGEITPSSSDTDMTSWTSEAWFGNYQSTKDAGLLNCNSVPMAYKDSSTGTTITYPMYMNSTTFFGTTLNFTTANPIVNWSVSGNTSNAIPAIDYNDSLAWGKLSSFVVPASSTAGSAITFQYNYSNLNTAPYEYLIYSVIGSKGNHSDTIAVHGSSFTVPSSITSAVAVAGDQMTVQLTLVKVSAAKTFGTKKYYFCKENVYDRFVQL